MATIDRIRLMELKRQRDLEELQNQKNKIQISNAISVTDISQKFATKSESIEEKLKLETVGLVSIDDFKKRRERLEIEEMARIERERVQVEKTEKKKRVVKVVTNRLSFALDDEEPEPEDEENVTNKKAKKEEKTKNEAEEQQTETKEKTDEKKEEKEEQTEEENIKRSKKNPFVNTSFLPDRDRDEWEMKVREQLAREFKAKQEREKNEMIEVTYSYWDGSGHRRTQEVKKGTSIAQFLDLVKREFKEIRVLSCDQLMFVKEDLILPQHFTFYDLIVSKARGKSGPLFSFDVHDDVRLLSDAKKEKDETHAAKVVDKRWYDKNKHIFPASRWEVYDPSVSRDSYSIRDTLGKH